MLESFTDWNKGYSVLDFEYLTKKFICINFWEDNKIKMEWRGILGMIEQN